MLQSNINGSIWSSKLAAIAYASILIPPSAGLVDFLAVALSKSSLKPPGLATLKERDRSTVLLLLNTLLALLDEEPWLCP